MFGSLRAVRLVKQAAFPGPGAAPIRCLASHNAHPWTNSASNRRRSQEDFSEEDLDRDAVENQMESLVKDSQRRLKATKFQKIRRQMSDRGAPERRLSWDAIEQIRFLKQESPQEWTVQRLAEGFSVSPDVISRILRSKFAPAPERKLKQDSKVLATVRPPCLRDGQTDQSRKERLSLPLPDGSMPAKLSSGNTLSALTALSPGAQTAAEFETRLLPSSGQHTSLSRGTSQISTALSVKPSALPEHPNEKHVDVLEGKVSEMELDWDRVFLMDRELEELILTFHEKPSKVEQKGREFFDSEGNFLYRI